MPSRCHTGCDGTTCLVSCGNVSCDGCDGMAGCRHNQPETGFTRPESRRHGGAVPSTIVRQSEISAITVHLPTTLPVLTPRAARALLAILVELTEIPVLEEVRYDR
jgi:hypothetical protein